MKPRTSPARRLLAAHIVVMVGIGVVVAVTFGTIIASLDRGFDWSDEGFVYAMVASNRVSTEEFWGFQYLLNPLYELLGSSVLAFRIVRLLGYLALGVALTLLARSLLRSRGIELGRSGWILVGLVAQIGTFAAWSYPPRYLGYNELSSWLTQLGAALVIFLLLEGRTTSGARAPRRWWLWLITGAVLSLLIVAKVTAGMFLLLLALLGALLASGDGSWWKRLGYVAGGLVAGALLMLAAGVPLLSYLATTAQLVADPSAQAESGYSVTTLLLRYLRSLAVTVGALAIPILLVAVLILVVRGLPADSVLARRVVVTAENVTLILALVLAVLVLSIVVFPNQADSWASLGFSNAFLLAIAVLSFAVLTARDTPNPAKKRRHIAIVSVAVVLFALAPLISALGTNNPIFGHTVFSVTIWAVGAAVGLVLAWRRSEAVTAAVRSLPLLLLGVIVATSGLTVAGDVFRHPYRTTPYFTQTTLVEVGELRGIRLTEGEADLYTWLHDAGERQDARGVPTLSIATPGALLAFNASGWSAIWPGPAWASLIARTCAEAVPDDLIVLQAANQEPGVEDHDRLVEGLMGCGIDFPGDFEVVERHMSSDPALDVRVWRLEARP